MNKFWPTHLALSLINADDKLSNEMLDLLIGARYVYLYTDD